MNQESSTAFVQLQPAVARANAVAPLTEAHVSELVAVTMLLSVVAAVIHGRPWELRQPLTLSRVEISDGLSVAVPKQIARTLAVQDAEGTQIFAFVNPFAYPVGVEPVVRRLPQTVGPEELGAAMQLELTELQKFSLPGAVRQGRAELSLVNGRPALVVAHRIDIVTLRSWISIFGSREVALHIFSSPERPPSWANLDEQIASSLTVR